MSKPQTPPAAPALAPLMTVADVADTLRTTRRTLERMRSAGEFPKPDLNVGRCPRWRSETVSTWIGNRAAS